MLSSAEFSDIHASVLDAMSYVVLPVVFYAPTAGQARDPLYGEVEGGDETFTEYARLKASVRLKPDEAWLTRTGLRVNADLLLFIPRGLVLAWETEQNKPFQPAVGMEVEYLGVRYAIRTEPRTDPLPTDNAAGYDYIGMSVLGHIKADTTRTAAA